MNHGKTARKVRESSAEKLCATDGKKFQDVLERDRVSSSSRDPGEDKAVLSRSHRERNISPTSQTHESDEKTSTILTSTIPTEGNS